MAILYLKCKLLYTNVFIELLYKSNICCTECQPCFFSQMKLQLRKKHNCECDIALNYYGVKLTVYYILTSTFYFFIQNPLRWTPRNRRYCETSPFVAPVKYIYSYDLSSLAEPS